MTRPLRRVLLLSLAFLAAALGCSDRYAIRQPPPNLLTAAPATRQQQPRWPTAVPPSPTKPTAPIQQAGLTQPAVPVAAAGIADAPRAFNPPILPKQETPAEIASAQGLARVEAICHLAQQKANDLRCYYVRLRKREVVNGQQLPEDVALMKFRNEPFSVYIKALEGSPTAGREIVFVNGRNNDMLQIRTGSGDIMSGMRLELSPSSPRATASSRRTVLEAGFPNIVARFAAAVQEEEKTHAALLTPLGPDARPDAAVPMECVKQVVPPGKEKHLPNGGVRYWRFAMDPRSPDYGLPMLIFTYDERQREVEYYAHDRLMLNVNLTDEDFDPNRLWASAR